jgi:hypothetical protein
VVTPRRATTFPGRTPPTALSPAATFMLSVSSRSAELRTVDRDDSIMRTSYLGRHRAAERERVGDALNPCQTTKHGRASRRWAAGAGPRSWYLALLLRTSSGS